MTSKLGASECFVYITLPGEETFVPAARLRISQGERGPLGELVYGRSYLARPDAVPLDPVELPLGARTYETRNLQGVFGALRDASPDFWGREFRLAPAYDLTPFTPVSVERRDLAMSAGDQGRYAQADNLLSQCARFLLTRDEASHLIDAMEKLLKARWYPVARASGVSEADCQKISGAFAYAGFRLQHVSPP
jgi:hypothetical protein